MTLSSYQTTDPVKSTVNSSLTGRRPQRLGDNDEFAAFTRRILHAYARRVAAGDIDAMTNLAALADETDAAIRRAITGLRGFGYSWAEIGAQLGVTRQAAQQRWGTPPARDGDAP